MIDNKITPTGRRLRNFGLDEILQLINVLKLQMSIIGPRPLTETDVKRLGWDEPYYDLRWNVKPGITGLAQLSEKCHAKITWMYDKYYVENYNFFLDIKIACCTIAKIITGKKRTIDNDSRQ